MSASKNISVTKATHNTVPCILFDSPSFKLYKWAWVSPIENIELYIRSTQRDLPDLLPSILACVGLCRYNVKCTKLNSKPRNLVTVDVVVWT